MRMPKTINQLLVALMLAITPLTLIAAECSAKSTSQTVPLLELYTSEGCSSCPPADKWFSGISLPGDKVVPLAYHVDYWDYIGWKDKFSKAEYSDKQRKQAAFGRAGFVYTPQFTFNGKDFKGWDNSRLNKSVELSLKQAAQANVSLNATTLENGEVIIKANVQLTKAKDAKFANIFVAIYENKLVSQINAGENNGRELKHDYVVRDLLGAYQINSKNDFSKIITLKSEWKGRNAGAVIFVQDTRNGEILQSLQLPFCG